MKGTLWLIPSTLVSPGEAPSNLDAVIPADVCHQLIRLEYFVVENAKSARAFLKACSMPRPIASLHIRELNHQTLATDLPTLLEPLRQGHDVGLLSEAGCPAVADPGAALVELAHQEGIVVKPLVGPNALLLALMASGLNGQSFTFHGYLPTDSIERANTIRALEQRSRQEQQTQLFIETPYRNDALFDALLQHLSAETRLCVATHLTLSDESIRTLPVREWQHTPRPTLRKKPTVFLFLAAHPH